MADTQIDASDSDNNHDARENSKAQPDMMIDDSDDEGRTRGDMVSEAAAQRAAAEADTQPVEDAGASRAASGGRQADLREMLGVDCAVVTSSCGSVAPSEPRRAGRPAKTPQQPQAEAPSDAPTTRARARVKPEAAAKEKAAPNKRTGRGRGK